LKLLMNRYCCI